MNRLPQRVSGFVIGRTPRACLTRGRIALTPTYPAARVERSWKWLDKTQRKGVVVSSKFLGKRNLAGKVLSPWLVATAGAFVMTNPARAFEPTDYLSYSYGPVTLRPRVNVTETYNDNVYYRENGPLKSGDLVNTFGAGVGITLGRRPELDPYNIVGDVYNRNYLSLDYGFNDSMYLSHSDLDGDQHTLKSTLNLQKNRITFTGQDQIEMATSVLGGGINYGEKTTRDSYNDNYRVNYALSTKTSMYLVGTRTVTDYAQGTPLLDSSTLGGAVGFAWSAFPRVSFFGESYYNLTSVDVNRASDSGGPDLTSIGGSIGAQGKFTDRIMGVIRVGYETHEFSDHTPTDDSPVASVQISYRLGEKTRTLLTYTRSVSVSSQLPGEAETYDVITFKLTRQIGDTSRWTASVGGDYQMGGFGNSGVYGGREDNWWHANCSLNYVIRLWMVSSLSLEHEDFTSNARTQGIFDYNANRVTIRLSVGY